MSVFVGNSAFCSFICPTVFLDLRWCSFCLMVFFCLIWPNLPVFYVSLSDTFLVCMFLLSQRTCVFIDFQVFGEFRDSFWVFLFHHPLFQIMSIRRAEREQWLNHYERNIQNSTPAFSFLTHFISWHIMLISQNRLSETDRSQSVSQAIKSQYTFFDNFSTIQDDKVQRETI